MTTSKLTPIQAAALLEKLYINGNADMNAAIGVAVDQLNHGSVVSLNDLMARQRQLMNLLGIPARLVGNPIDSPIMKDTLIMLMSEVQEALDPLTLDSKPWKSSKYSRKDILDEVIAETTDILFLLLEVMLLLNLSADRVMELYELKRQEIIVNRLGELPPNG